MSGLGLTTRKVNVYGRKKTQILSVHMDLSPAKPAWSQYTPSSDALVPPSPSVTRRPPLIAKTSLNVVTTRDELASDDFAAKKGGKIKGGKADKATKNLERESDDEVVVLRRRRGCRPVGSAISAKPRTNAALSTPSKSARKLVSVEIPVTRPRRPRAETPARETSAAPEGDEDSITASLDRLNLGANQTPTPAANPLLAILAVCDSRQIETFDTLRSVLAPQLGKQRSPADPATPTTIIKVGEASYSEVFGVLGGSADDQGMVVKVVPLTPGRFNRDDKLPECSDPADVLREIQITRKLSGLPEGGFVQYKQAYVVRGAYPQYLLHAWDEYKLDYGTYSKRPDVFEAEQTYAVIVLSNQGADLEAFQFDASCGWIQALSVLLQTARSLAAAEKDSSFEHRDLHEGQVLISKRPGTIKSSSASANDYTPSATGVSATIIDFGLSRIAMDQCRVMFSRLPQDLFDSKGEQWDVYRSMRDVIGEDWAGFHPVTNVMWLHYIARYMIHRSSLKAPKARGGGGASSSAKQSKGETARSSASERDQAAYATMQQIEEMLLGSVAAAKAGSEDRPRRGGRVVCGSAADVVAWAEGMGWKA